MAFPNNVLLGKWKCRLDGKVSSCLPISLIFKHFLDNIQVKPFHPRQLFLWSSNKTFKKWTYKWDWKVYKNSNWNFFHQQYLKRVLNNFIFFQFSENISSVNCKVRRGNSREQPGWVRLIYIKQNEKWCKGCHALCSAWNIPTASSWWRHTARPASWTHTAFSSPVTREEQT